MDADDIESNVGIFYFELTCSPPILSDPSVHLLPAHTLRAFRQRRIYMDSGKLCS